LVDEERDRAVHQAEVHRVEEQRDVEDSDGTGRERAAEAREGEGCERLGPGVAVGLGHHHRRADQIGRNDARRGDDRFMHGDPSDDPDSSDGDHAPLGGAHAAFAATDREQEDEAGHGGLGAGHDEAP
jgi:hypothetical protein